MVVTTQPGSPPGPAPRVPRRHRSLTIPAGLLLFACIALPGFRDCGRSVAMAGDPTLAAICGFGLIAAALSIAVRPRVRGERVAAIALVASAVVAAGFLGLEWLARDHVYAGITLGTAAAICLVAGAVVWDREARGRDETARRFLRVLLPLAIVAVAAIAALSDWAPAPDNSPNIPYLGPR
jgi:lysylphosphatidylglycerol synthetase-like protein (DUF2156 family)